MAAPCKRIVGQVAASRIGVSAKEPSINGSPSISTDGNTARIAVLAKIDSSAGTLGEADNLALQIDGHNAHRNLRVFEAHER